MKKISEWLEMIPDEGIRKAAISQMTFDDIEVDSMDKAICYFGSWAATKEGIEYWANVAASEMNTSPIDLQQQHAIDFAEWKDENFHAMWNTSGKRYWIMVNTNDEYYSNANLYTLFLKSNP